MKEVPISKPKAPKPPDYAAAAERTAQGNREAMEWQTQANRPDQYTPFGSTTWDRGANNQWTQRTNLTPEAQAALDSQMGLQMGRSQLGESMMGRAQDEFGEAVNWDDFDALGGSLGDAQMYGDRAGDAMYGRATSRLDPQWEQRAEAKESQLRNQGLRPGDEAYDTAMANMGRERTDAYQQAGYGADMAAASEGARMQGMDKTSSAYDTQRRQQQIAETLQARGWSLNEINALVSGQQVGMPSMPGFNTEGYTAGTDYSGAAGSQWGADLDVYSAQNAANQALMEGVTSLGGAAMGMSDRRLKRNIKQIGTYKGYALYIWDYIWGEKGCGVMSDEIPQQYVFKTYGGYDMVDYGRL